MKNLHKKSNQVPKNETGLTEERVREIAREEAAKYEGERSVLLLESLRADSRSATKSNQVS